MLTSHQTNQVKELITFNLVTERAGFILIQDNILGNEFWQLLGVNLLRHRRSRDGEEHRPDYSSSDGSPLQAEIIS